MATLPVTTALPLGRRLTTSPELESTFPASSTAPPFSLTESLKLSSRSGALGELGLEGLFAGPIPPMWG